MPTTPRKARLLLDKGKAKVIGRTPFTIQLKYASGETKQPIKLGIDAGYSMIGFSAITDKHEVIAGEVTIRKDVSKKITEKRMYRRIRRGKLRYRKARFKNRRRKKSWFAPSIQHKLETYIQLIEKLKIILPITKTIVEIATFDIHKMQNPEIKGIEYQQGKLQGYEVREYLLAKWGRKCVYCQKSGLPLEIEHIIPKSRGGSNRVSNLTIACSKCNLKKGNKTATEFGYPRVQKQAKKSLKSATFMNTIRQRIVDKLNCQFTFGFITKYQRTQLGLSKSHTNDAFVIAGGNKQHRANPFAVKQIRRNNRSLQKNRKGFNRSVRTQRYPYQPNDLVRYNHQFYRVNGTHCKGTRVVLFTPTYNNKKQSVSSKKIELVKYGKGLSFFSIPSHAQTSGIPRDDYYE
jgi:5-methylcytosine-specific restriction endonuclease McrA